MDYRNMTGAAVPCDEEDTEADELFGGDTASGEDEEKGRSVEELFRLLSQARKHSSCSRDEDEDDEDDDEDDDDEDIEDDDEDDDEDEDEDEDDDEEEDDDEDEDGEDESVSRRSDSGKVGKRVILRSDYKSNKAYCDAVVKSMQALLRRIGIREEPRSIRSDVKVFAFDRTTQGVDIDCHILCEYQICNYRIEFKFNVRNQPGRTPLIDYFCQDKNFPLRYGALIMDHTDGEKKLEYSTCFYGAFSEEAFTRYWDALNSTLRAYAREYESVAGEKKLEPERRRLARKMVGDLSGCLSAKVRPENAEKLARLTEALGGTPGAKTKKLLNYIVEHS